MHDTIHPERIDGQDCAVEAPKAGELIELKFNVEAVTLCGGHCAGCMLDAPERQTTTSLDDRFLSALAETILTLRQAERAAQPGRWIETVINFGQGDHLLLSDEELLRRLDWLEAVRDGNRPATCFMTVSGITKPAVFAERVQALHSASLLRKQLLNLDVVLDPVLVQATTGAREMLAANVASVLRVFGGCDLHVNVGPDTLDAISPEELLGFCRDNGITSLTTNLVPTRASAARFATRWPQLVEWMRRLCEHWAAEHTELNFNGAINVLLALRASDPQVHGAEVSDGMRHRRLREFYITPDGAVHLAQTGLGDVAFTPRSGFQPIGSVYDAQRLLLVARTGLFLGVQRSGVFRAVHSACAGCRYRDACQISGMRNALGVLQEVEVGRELGEETCPIGVDAVFDVVKEVYDAGDYYQTLPCFSRTGLPHAQAGLALDTSFPQAWSEQRERVRFWARKAT